MNDEEKIRRIVEGLLMASHKPLSLDRISQMFADDERPEPEVLKNVLEAIGESCADRGFELKMVASGYRFQVKEEVSDWIGRLWEEKPQRYSRALLETLAIIAYRQPITRGDIEKVRGVAVSTSIIRTLLDREWIRVVGHRDVPGRPAMYASTREFLDYFNLESLEQLPALSEIRDMEGVNQELTPEEEQPPTGNVIEFPTLDNQEDEVVVPDEEEEAAAAIGTRSMDEILGIKTEESPAGEDDGDESAQADDDAQSRNDAAVTDDTVDSDSESGDSEADDDEPDR